MQSWACLVGTVVTGLPTLVLFAYGGVFQVPAVVALGAAGAVPNRRIFPEGSSWLTKIGWIAFALVVVYVGLFIVAIVVRIVLSASP